MVMKVDFTQLNTAADKWDEMAGEFKKLEDRYRDRIQNVSLDGTWTGQASLYSRPNFATTRHEYAAAQVEAKAIASLLRDAYAHFIDLKKKVEHARQDAIDAKMKVSADGAASIDFSKLSPTEADSIRRDPDAKTIEASWTKHINDAVVAVDDADRGLKIALEAAVVDIDLSDGTLNGFNGKASGDVEHYEAEAALDLANKVNDGKKLSPEEMSRFESLMRDNSHDKVFSQTLLASLGPDGTVKLTNQLNNWAYGSDKGRKDDYMALEKGMANSLAAATDVPGSTSKTPPGSRAFQKWLDSPDGTFYREFMGGMDKTGTHNYGDKLRPLHGYQSLAGLMQHADTKYDDQFLNDLGDRMISAEKKDRHLFTTWGADYQGTSADPIDGLLRVMSKNPEAATAFFDPAGNGEGTDHVANDHLKYLVGSGDGAREWPRHSVAAGGGIATNDLPDSHVGLGVALEAAATGQLPLEANQDPWPDLPHSAAQARVMHNVVEQFKPSSGTDVSVPEALRQPLAKALSTFTSDTHNILGGMDYEYIGPSTGSGEFLGDDGRHHMSVTQKDLVQFMRGLSEDPDAYADMHKAESRYIDNALNGIPHGATGFDQSSPMSKAGAALGAYSAIREDVVNDGRMASYNEADWKSKIAYHIIGGIVTPMEIPTAGGSIVVGDAIQRGVDTWAWQMGNSMKAEADAKANAEIADLYLNANSQVPTLVHSWAEGRGGISKATELGLVEALLNGQDRGSNTAHKYLTDTSN